MPVVGIGKWSAAAFSLSLFPFPTTWNGPSRPSGLSCGERLTLGPRKLRKPAYLNPGRREMQPMFLQMFLQKFQNAPESGRGSRPPLP